MEFARRQASILESVIRDDEFTTIRNGMNLVVDQFLIGVNHQWMQH